MAMTSDVQNWVLAADDQDLEQLMRLIQLRRNSLSIKAGLAFKPGDKVWFDAKRRGIIYGTFIKLNQKNAKVKATNGMTWTVSPSLLHADTRTSVPATKLVFNPIAPPSVGNSDDENETNVVE